MQLRHFATTLGLTLTKSDTNSCDELRPCQRAYFGESNARRVLRRAQLSRKVGVDPIFAVHNETTTSSTSTDSGGSQRTPFTPFELATRVKTGNTVHCYAAHAEDEAKRKEAETAKTDKMLLLNSINLSRVAEGRSPLIISQELCAQAQYRANELYAEDHNASCPGNPSITESQTNKVIVVLARDGRRNARLTSQPNIGALACGEMWYGGKYRRHLYPVEGEGVAAHHPDDCPCHLRIVFETMVDQGWVMMGVGKNEDGRWVVELA